MSLTSGRLAVAPMSRNEFARLFGVSGGTVTNWMTAGMPATRKGRQGAQVSIDPYLACPWVYAHREEAPGSQRDRLAKEQADKLALENARRRGELIFSHQVAESLSKLAAELSARLDAVAGRTASEFAGITDAGTIRRRMLDELRNVRAAFADTTAELADALGADPDDGGDPEAAPEKDGERVGRGKSRAASRKRRARAVSK